jgi:hypothetical protein
MSKDGIKTRDSSILKKKERENFTQYAPRRKGICLRQVNADFRDSIVVSISACHADDPGSIPGRGVFPPKKQAHIFVATITTSDAGTRTRVAWVKARYPNQLDYIGWHGIL